MQANQTAAQRAADAAPRQAYDSPAQSLQVTAPEQASLSQKAAADQALQHSLPQKPQQEPELEQPTAGATRHTDGAAPPATSLLQAGRVYAKTGDDAAVPAAKPMLPFAQV